jgi:DNA-binding CsgD family transcriptional regulator
VAEGPTDQTEDLATRTVACIDVRLSGSAPSPGSPRPEPGLAAPALDVALRRIQQVVRSGDRICPMGTSRLAIEFAPVDGGVAPQILGDRLARAIGQQIPLDSTVGEVAVSVGMAAPEQHFGPAELTRRALSAAQAGTSQLGRTPFAGTHASTTIVTVDHLVAPRTAAHRTDRPFQSLHRRIVYRYDAGRIRGIPTLTPRRCTPQAGPADRTDGSRTPLTVLVIDPMTSATGYPGLAATTAASLAEQAGCRTATVAAGVDDPLALAVDGVALDLVLLVLDGGWVGHSPSWSSSAWGIPARLTTAYRNAGVRVVAVSAGSGAGAVASCVAQGAEAAFNLDQLGHLLRSSSRDQVTDGQPLADLRLPPRFRALVGLTVSERRVLFYLTEGWAAQDIADELVVSLTTVRSHIRSVLRKLGVRSQLAAVAIANSRDLEPDDSGDSL